MKEQSEKHIEVDRANIKLILRQPRPVNIKLGFQNFMGLAGFYRKHYIIDFFKISKLLCDLLAIEATWDLNDVEDN